MKVANATISPKGVKKILLARLSANEQLRHTVFAGRIRQSMDNDKIRGAEEQLSADYQAGLMYVHLLN